MNSKTLYIPYIMEGLLKAPLAGIALGGFAAIVVEVNQIALKTLWKLNCIDAETAWGMFKASLTNIHREQLHQWQRLQQQQKRRRQWLQQRMAAAQTENEDENDGEDES